MTSRRARYLVLSATLALGVAGCETGVRQQPTYHFKKLGIPAATVDRMIVCHGFGCARRTTVQFSASDHRRLKAMFAGASRSPKAERRAIGKAVMWFDRRFGPEVGTDKDVGGFDPGNAGKVGQQDCVDDATSTAGLLVLFQKNGLLTHHKVGMPVARGFFLDGRYPHATATIVNKSDDVAWAVDPWPYDAGEPPDIIPLSRWFEIRRGGARKSS